MTPVTRSVAVLAGASLVTGLLATAPASAERRSDPVSGLVGQVLGPPSSGPDGGQRRSGAALGSTAAADGVLRQGCHNHYYRYVVRVTTDDWTLETFLDDRTGDTIASGTYIADSDARRARKVFRFCRWSTRPGRFTIRAKLTWYTDSGEHRGWFEPSHFRLRRP